MVLKSYKKIFRRNWDLILMPETVISSAKILGGDQPKIITFTDRHGRLIEDVETSGLGDNSDEGEVELSGVDTEI